MLIESSDRNIFILNFGSFFILRKISTHHRYSSCSNTGTSSIQIYRCSVKRGSSSRAIVASLTKCSLWLFKSASFLCRYVFEILHLVILFDDIFFLGGGGMKTKISRTRFFTKIKFVQYWSTYPLEIRYFLLVHFDQKTYLVRNFQKNPPKRLQIRNTCSKSYFTLSRMMIKMQLITMICLKY